MTIESPETCGSAVVCSAWLGRIVCGDNTEVLSCFPDACIDLVVTSPPYDDLRTYGGHSWNFEALAAQLVRVLKPGGVIVWVVADATVDGSETLTSMRQAIHFKDACGLNVHDTMIYQRWTMPRLGPGQDRRCVQEFEFMFVLSKGRPTTANPPKRPCKHAGRKWSPKSRDNHGDGLVQFHTTTADETIKGNIWEYWARGQAENGNHPATFPEALAKDHIGTWSNPGDVVLDPFSGSGTTCKAAKELNRQWCGIEINPEYCAIAEARLSQDVLQLETCAMRPNEKADA